MLLRLLGDEFEIRMLLDPCLEPVSADPNQMEQVLLNFCINARDAMPEGGRITIETTNMEVDASMVAQHPALAPGRYVKLAVSDTGTGMEQETLSHIFEPFFTTKGQGHGTGLGLATVYGIVEQSGGHVTAYSEPGQGSTFCVYLPVTQHLAAHQGPVLAPEIMPGGTETILLVEDAAPLRALYRTFLESQGYTVLAAEDGERALKAAGEFPGRIDLLLTDVSLPKLKGPALAKALLQPRPELRVLLVSGFADNAIADGQAPDGAAFLQKPFGREVLVRKVRDMLDGR
jgi:CheY-like chemotaxis protein